MKRVLSYGMVGGGPDAFIGDAHRKSIGLDGRAVIKAGCFSRDYEKNKSMGEKLGIDSDRCYRTYEEMAEKEAERKDGIDFVIVVTPNKSHYEICKAFLNNGINVSCDKPVTVESWQAEELKKIASSKGLLFMVTYTYSGHVTFKHAREIIKKGEIGDIRTVMAEYPQGWLAFEGDFGGKQGTWRCNPDESGRTNALGDIGTHIENTVARMTGLRIKRVLAKMDKIVPGRVLDDNDVVMVEYDNGASGVYWSSQIAIGHDNGLRVRVYGSKGTLMWFQEEPEKITVINEQGDVRELHRGHKGIDPGAAKYARLPSGHAEGWFEAMANLYMSFIDCINAKEENIFNENMIDYPTIDDGIEGIKFIEGCLKSSNEGNIWTEL